MAKRAKAAGVGLGRLEEGARAGLRAVGIDVVSCYARNREDEKRFRYRSGL